MEEKDNMDRLKHGWGERLLHIQNSPGNPLNWFKKEEDDGNAEES